jgi:phage replication initiation protein
MNRALVDWMTCTFAMQAEQASAMVRAIGFAIGKQVQAVERRVRYGFSEGVVIHAWTGREFVEVGTLCWGGEAQRGRAMLEIPGSSCGLVDWPAMRDLVESLPESRLTRVDVAVDLHDGAYSVDDAVFWVGEGRFNCKGRNPSTRIDGDWLRTFESSGFGDGPYSVWPRPRSEKGRTLYVGKASNGKGLRVYEKGRQLGDPQSEWVRFEVQFGNRDRVLPFELLTEPDRFFAGAYPALEVVLGAAGDRIATISNVAEITIGRVLEWMRASAGKWLHVAVDSGIPVSDLVEEVRVRAMPRRVQAQAVAAGLLRECVRAGFDKWRQSCRGNV